MGIIFYVSHLVIMSAPVAWPCDRLTNASSLSPALTLVLHVANWRLLIMSQQLHVGFRGKQRLHWSLWFKVTTKMVISDIILTNYICALWFLCMLPDINFSEKPVGWLLISKPNIGCSCVDDSLRKYQKKKNQPFIYLRLCRLLHLKTFFYNCIKKLWYICAKYCRYFLLRSCSI